MYGFIQTVNDLLGSIIKPIDLDSNDVSSELKELKIEIMKLRSKLDSMTFPSELFKHSNQSTMSEQLAEFAELKYSEDPTALNLSTMNLYNEIETKLPDLWLGYDQNQKSKIHTFSVNVSQLATDAQLKLIQKILTDAFVSIT